jgi:23S rRNA (guanine745-N1)-methyltransferase
MLSSAIVRVLACPICHASLAATPGRLGCRNQHHFDLSRWGHVHLGRGQIPSGDTAAMVEARRRFLARGHYAPLAASLASIVAAGPPPAYVVDVGAGPGYYLATIVERSPSSWGIAVDVSRFAARRAARVHPRIGSVVADHRALPVRDGMVDVVTCVFAPRDPRELRRVLRPGGRCLVATPSPAHLAEIRERHGGLGIEPRKRERLLCTFDPWFELGRTTELELELVLGGEEIADVLGMGPAAFHPDRVVITSGVPVRTTAAFEIFELHARRRVHRGA